YTKQIINQFKHGDDPEILIVVDKLLTGFDAPRNTVLYLCRTLREHTLLQAIARVNRLYEGKEFGYIIDYASVLGELDKALTMYEAFEGFD
ncbi:type I restriction endonuclease subunit R, partial [Escherichia coli]|nr:type I restriction endonuclease subunit R [Escherichia coli]